MDNNPTNKSPEKRTGPVEDGLQTIVSAYHIFESKFWPLFTISFIGSLAYAGGTTALAFAVGIASALPGSMPVFIRFAGPILLGVLSVLLFILQIWSGLAALSTANSPSPVGILKSYYSTVNKLWSYAWTGFLSLSVCLGLIVFLVIPSLVASVWLSLSTVFVVTQNKRGLEALSASKELVKGQWRQTAFFLLTVMLILFIVFYASAILRLPTELWSLLVNTLSGAFWAAALVALYQRLIAQKSSVQTSLHKNRQWPYIALAIIGTLVIASSLSFFIYSVFRLKNDALRLQQETLIQKPLAGYKQKKGSFPADLSQLTPEFLPTIPVDPATNKPFSYAPADNGADYILIIDYDQFGRQTLTSKSNGPLPDISNKK